MAEPEGVPGVPGEPASAAGPEVAVRRLAEDDWATYRDIRLEMLRDSPSAFSMTYEQSLLFDEAHWRKRLADNGVFLAVHDGAPVGSATCSGSGAVPEESELVAMWVAPQSRGTGAARMLVEAATQHARELGKHRLMLSVVDHNERGRRLYERCGFVLTGESDPYPHDPNVLELRMQRVLFRADDAG